MPLIKVSKTQQSCIKTKQRQLLFNFTTEELDQNKTMEADRRKIKQQLQVGFHLLQVYNQSNTCIYDKGKKTN